MFAPTSKALSRQRRKLTFPCRPEAEPEIQGLLVSDVTAESFGLAWTADEEALDTFVVMVRPADDPGHPRELVLTGRQRSVAVSNLTEDTEYKIEMFGLRSGRSTKSVQDSVRTGKVGRNKLSPCSFQHVTHTHTHTHQNAR